MRTGSGKPARTDVERLGALVGRLNLAATLALILALVVALVVMVGLDVLQRSVARRG